MRLAAGMLMIIPSTRVMIARAPPSAKVRPGPERIQGPMAPPETIIMSQMPDAMVTNAVVIMTSGILRCPNWAMTGAAAEPAARRDGIKKRAVNRTDPTQNTPARMWRSRRT
jgi:hypothetical protein